MKYPVPGECDKYDVDGLCSYPLDYDGNCPNTPQHVNPPAFDSEFRPCWNVWVDNRLPETFHTYAEAWRFADKHTDAGHKVFTDFDAPPLGVRP